MRSRPSSRYGQDSSAGKQPMPLWQKIVAILIGLVFLSFTMGSVLALFFK